MTFDSNAAVDIDPAVDTSGEPVSGWVTTPSVASTAEKCKRHSYRGGNVCLRCGTPKPERVSRRSSDTTSSDSSRERAPSDNVRVLRGAISLGWLGMGYALEEFGKPVKVAKPVGRVLQFEAAVAGTRVQKVLRKTPAWKPIMAAMSRVGPWADLAPLLGPPILVGLMTWQPRMRPVLGGVLASLLVPLLAEAEKAAEEQQEAMKALGNFTEENMERAHTLVSAILDYDESSEGTAHSNGSTG